MLLAESGQTIIAFAKTLGTSRQSLGYYLNGERIPDALMVRQIAERCNVSADWLLGLSDVRTQDTDLKEICAYTGLSDTAIIHIHNLEKHSPELSTLEMLTKDDAGIDIIKTIAEYIFGLYAEPLFVDPKDGQVKPLPFHCVLYRIRNNVEHYVTTNAEVLYSSYLAETLKSQIQKLKKAVETNGKP